MNIDKVDKDALNLFYRLTRGNEWVERQAKNYFNLRSELIYSYLDLNNMETKVFFELMRQAWFQLTKISAHSLNNNEFNIGLLEFCIDPKPFIQNKNLSGLNKALVKFMNPIEIYNYRVNEQYVLKKYYAPLTFLEFFDSGNGVKKVNFSKPQWLNREFIYDIFETNSAFRNPNYTRIFTQEIEKFETFNAFKIYIYIMNEFWKNLGNWNAEKICSFVTPIDQWQFLLNGTFDKETYSKYNLEIQKKLIKPKVAFNPQFSVFFAKILKPALEEINAKELIFRVNYEFLTGERELVKKGGKPAKYLKIYYYLRRKTEALYATDLAILKNSEASNLFQL